MTHAWLAAWLGLGGRRFPGIAAAYAITDDFAAAVIDARLDSEKRPERLELKGRTAEATLALAGIRHIERTVLQHRLLPTPDDLALCHDKVLRLYSAAYAWPAPPLPPYQQAGVARLLTAPGVLLADEIGLGKTIQAIGALRVLLRRKASGSLLPGSASIVVPAGLVLQWRRQLPG